MVLLTKVSIFTRSVLLILHMQIWIWIFSSHEIRARVIDSIQIILQDVITYQCPNLDDDSDNLVPRLLT